MICKYFTFQGYCYYGDVLLSEKEQCGASIKVLQESEKCKYVCEHTFDLKKSCRNKITRQ